MTEVSTLYPWHLARRLSDAAAKHDMREINSLTDTLASMGLARLRTDDSKFQPRSKSADNPFVSEETMASQNVVEAVAELGSKCYREREELRAVIRRAANIMRGGEGVQDQGEAWDKTLRLLDSAVATFDA